jgi:hypothetical protein
MPTLTPSRLTGKDRPSDAVWCERQVFLATLRDARRVATKAAERLYNVQFAVVLHETPDKVEIAVHVADRAIGQSYRIPIPEGLVRFDTARLIINEIRDRRQEAAAEPWHLCMPSAWQLV